MSTINAYRARQAEAEREALAQTLQRIAAEHEPIAEATLRRDEPRPVQRQPKPVKRCGHFGAWAVREET
jgi:hypothetical protein